MADAERPNANTLAAAFPPPPFFFRSFSQENTERINELRAAQEAESESSESAGADGPPSLPTRVLDLPSELLFLQPPLPPTDGLYGVFGSRYTLREQLPTLAEQGQEQLYEEPPDTPSASDSLHDRNFVLKKLTKSLLLNYMELIGVMSINPELGEAKIADLRTHFVNIYHLLNQYRPHQARESLILLMEEQVEKSKAETEAIYASTRKVEEVLNGLRKIEIPDLELPIKVDSQAHKDDEGYDAWAEMDDVFK